MLYVAGELAVAVTLHLQADVTAEGTDSSHQEYSGPESQAEDTDLRPSFLR